MEFFGFLKKKHSAVKESTFDNPCGKINAPPAPEPISSESYSHIRKQEHEWFDTNYNLSTISGIQKIPSVKGLRCPYTSGVTGRLYYYLRHKAHQYEEENRLDLAEACMRKSCTLAMIDYGASIQKVELYPLVKLLARAGRVEEAISTKERIDQYCQKQRALLTKHNFQSVLKNAEDLSTDLIIMSAHGAACSECARFQGRVYSISGATKKYPKLPAIILENGSVHPGCAHSFYPYFEFQDSGLERTLAVHPLKNPWHRKNIVAFSNRPFIDDRTRESKKLAEDIRAEIAAKKSQETELEENFIEYEVKRGIDMRNFRWVQENLPEKCPKSLSGYRRMKTQNTKNFQVLKQLAAELGKSL